MESRAKKFFAWLLPRDRWEAAIVLGGLGLRLAIFFALVGFIGIRGLSDFNDAREYIDLARGMIENQRFGYGPDSLETNRVPGYPAFLAAFMALGLPLWSASLVQLAAASLVPLLALRISGELGFGKTIARGAGLFAAFEPLQAYYSVTLLSDSLAATLFLAGAYLLILFWRDGKKTFLVFSAAILGAANYIRPLGMFLFLLVPLVMLAAAFLEKKAWKRALASGILFGAVFYATLVPWMIRNERQFGSWSLSSAPQRQLFDYTAATVLAAAKGMSFDEAQERLRTDAGPYLPVPGQTKHFANAAILSDRAVAVIRAHPAEFLSSYALSLQTLLASGNYHYFLAEYRLIPWPAGGTTSFTILFASGNISDAWGALGRFVTEPYGLVALAGKAFWLAAFACAVFGAVEWARAGRGESRFGAMFFLGILLYLSVVTVTLVGGTEARHRLFLNPLYFIFMMHGILTVARSLRFATNTGT